MNEKWKYQPYILKHEVKYPSQSAFTCLKLTTETLEKSVKYVQS